VSPGLGRCGGVVGNLDWLDIEGGSLRSARSGRNPVPRREGVDSPRLQGGLIA
jgi:hypothetical protein